MSCRKREGLHVAVPEYGNAPAELVEKHMKLANRMAELYDAGESLTSEVMLDLSREINEVNRQIAAYYPENQK